MNRRQIIVLSLLGFGVLFSVFLYLISGINNNLVLEGRGVQHNNSTNRTSTQPLIELLRFRESLLQYTYGLHAINKDDLLLRFDIYWSRLPLLVESNEALLILQVPNIKKNVRLLTQSLERIEPLLAAHSIEDENIYHKIRDELAFHFKILNDIALKSNTLERLEAIKTITKFRELKRKIIIVLVLSLLVTGFIYILFLFQLNKKMRFSRKLENQIAEQEQVILERTTELNIKNEKLEKLSHEDGLTGLYNRRYLDEALTREVSRALRSRTHLALLMCDIDYFKQYNDTFGHLAGDHCLQEISNCLNLACQRGSDIVVRYGGEELVVLLPDTSLEMAIQTAKRIGNDVLSKKIKAGDNVLFEYVSVSIGVAELQHEKIYSQERLIATADTHLYKAKEAGRRQLSSDLGFVLFDVEK